MCAPHNNVSMPRPNMGAMKSITVIGMELLRRWQLRCCKDDCLLLLLTTTLGDIAHGGLGRGGTKKVTAPAL